MTGERRVADPGSKDKRHCDQHELGNLVEFFEGQGEAGEVLPVVILAL